MLPCYKRAALYLQFIQHCMSRSCLHYCLSRHPRTAVCWLLGQVDGHAVTSSPVDRHKLRRQKSLRTLFAHTIDMHVFHSPISSVNDRFSNYRLPSKFAHITFVSYVYLCSAHDPLLSDILFYRVFCVQFFESRCCSESSIDKSKASAYCGTSRSVLSVFTALRRHGFGGRDLPRRA